MEDYKKELMEQKKLIENLLKQSEKNLNKHGNVPEGHVRMSYSQGCPQFYYAAGEGAKLTYVKHNQLKGIAKILQRDYDIKVNKKLKALEHSLCCFLRDYDINAIEQVYQKLPRAKRDLVNPIIESDENYVEKWRDEHPGGKNTFPTEGKLYTARGECVRSKSEKIIADLLDKMGVPYAYEPRLELNRSNVIYPDFAVLNIRLRKTLYWEHLGMIDSEEYAVKNLDKIREYEKSGFEIGEQLILSMESGKETLDFKKIEEKIIRYCI